MDFWVRSEDGDELLRPQRVNIRKTVNGFALGCYESNTGWVRLADFADKDLAKAHLDNIQCIMVRKSNERYIYDLAKEVLIAGKSSE